MKYYLGLDVGTTLITAVAADEGWRVAAKASRAHRQIYPRPGWVEQDPLELYENCLAAVQDVLARVGASGGDVAALGLDHQGETCLLWDAETGLPLYNAVVWQDRRTAAEAEALDASCGDEIRDICGLRPDAYYSATKLRWLLENVPAARESLARGTLRLGTLNTWLFWKFSGGRCYRTDPGSAGCMMLMDLHTLCWSERLCELTGVPMELLPELCDNDDRFGETEPDSFLGLRIPLMGSVADSPAGIIGGGCAGEGILKTSYGTGSFMTLQTGEKILLPEGGLVSDCMWRIGGRTAYRMRGACYTAGAAVEWMRRGMEWLQSPEESETLALSVPDTGGVYFVPALSGLATPFWDPYARGTFVGITGGTTRAHMVRAVLESLAYQVANCYAVMRRARGADSPAMRVDGGMVDNGFLMQFQADLLGIPVEVPAEKETAAFGSACLAGVATGALPSPESVGRYAPLRRVYEPRMSPERREEGMARWLQAVERSRSWAKPCP